VSRLLIDPNRGEDDPTLIMQLSDGAVIPGNRDLDTAERARRIQRHYHPYHQAIDRVVSACRASGCPPIIFSVHSMTHAWKGVSRPWHVSILWQDDFGLAQPLLRAFRADPNLVVGDNVPYAGGLEGDTLFQHARPHRLPNAVIEYRQDLVADVAGQREWADRTITILKHILDAQHPSVLQEHTMTTPNTPALDAATQTELEAAAFRKLVAHLRTRSDVQNIDMMNLAGFCRNCLANWYQEAAVETGLDIGKDAARAHVYGMPYKDWQAKHQKEASPAQKAAFAANKPHGH
jgi:predicted N-formylglutamate amidohydrolase